MEHLNQTPADSDSTYGGGKIEDGFAGDCINSWSALGTLVESLKKPPRPGVDSPLLLKIVTTMNKRTLQSLNDKPIRTYAEYITDLANKETTEEAKQKRLKVITDSNPEIVRQFDELVAEWNAVKDELLAEPTLETIAPYWIKINEIFGREVE